MEDYIKNLVKNGGPEPHEYDELNEWFKTISSLLDKYYSREDIQSMWEVFKDAFSEQTMQGFVVNKPHGYAGDFEVIDRIYTEWHSPEKHLRKWDRFFHWHAAPKAVRNRKAYFIELLLKLEASTRQNPSVLNVGSGPGRDVCEYLDLKPNTKIDITCLDMDEKAIEYAQDLIGEHKSVEFICRNAFRYRSSQKYDLVWSAGLFDYLDERKFESLFQTLYKLIRPGGALVVGNFSESNPSREYMEFGEWFLYHRSDDDLLRLAINSGVNASMVKVDKEPSGVNLFLVAQVGN